MSPQVRLASLSTEMLMKIFELVPDKSALKHSCLSFYRIVCRVEMFRVRLVIKDVRRKKSFASFDGVELVTGNNQMLQDDDKIRKEVR
jgi:hypothetical protein